MDEKLELDALIEEIKLTEQKLSDLRKEYRDPVDFWRGRAY